MADYINYKQNALKNIKQMQAIVKGSDFKNPEKFSPEERKKVYASLLAARWAVEAQRGKKGTLKADVPQEAFQNALNQILNSKTVDAFLAKEGEEQLQSLLLEGHGGAAEDKLKEYMLEQPTLTADIPSRYMPTYSSRIENLQQKLSGETPDSPEAARIYAEIFRTRRAAGAVRKQGALLEGPVDGAAMEKVPDLSKTEAFKSFVAGEPEALHGLIVKGHGGEAEETFRTFIHTMDHIPQDTPDDYMPTAMQRTEGLKKRIQDPGFPLLDDQEKQNLLTEMVAARIAVDAQRKKPETLEKKPTSKDLDAAVTKLKESKTFQNFLLADESKVIKAATDGHGGALEDDFKAHVLDQDHIASDVPARYMPTASARITSLKKKMNSPEFRGESPESYDRRFQVCAELLATRDAVGYVRGGDREVLDKTLEPEALDKAHSKWSACTTLRQFLDQDPKTARKAAATGHGSELERKFKNYVAGLDHLPSDLPASMMPTAMERITALQKKIQAPAFRNRSPQQQMEVFAELMAARQSVGAKRNSKDHLSDKLDLAAVKTAYEQWSKDPAFKDYLENNMNAVIKASKKDYGGAMIDGYKSHIRKMDVIPDTVPFGALPTAEKRIEGLKQKIKGLQDDDLDRAKTLYGQILATRSACGAVRKKKDSLKGVINIKKVAEDYDKLMASETFKDFVESGEGAKAAVTGHGGALEDSFKDYVKKLEVLPTDVPKRYMPTGLERIAALQKKFKPDHFNTLTHEEKLDLAAELMATRLAVGAERGKEDSLKRQISPEKLKKAREALKKSKDFSDFLEKNSEAVRKAAAAGHGGALDDLFKKYLMQKSVLHRDTPKEYMPTALDRTKELQEQIKKTQDPTQRKYLYTSLAAARMCVSSTRGDRKSLEIQMDPGKQADAYEELRDSEAFKDMLENTPDNVIYSAARTGHGGAMDDLFKTHVIKQTAANGRLPKGVNDRFKPMPNQVLEQVKKDLAEMARHDDAWFLTHKDEVRKKLATGLYLLRADLVNRTTESKKAALNTDKMGRRVDVLASSGAMDSMLETVGGLKQAALKMSRNPRSLAENFVAPPEQPAPALQPNLQRQNQMNNNRVVQQPNNLQNLQNNQPNVQPNNQPDNHVIHRRRTDANLHKPMGIQFP